MVSVIVIRSLFLLRLSSSLADQQVFQPVISQEEKAWKAGAIQKLWEERLRMDHTMDIIYFKIPGLPMLDLYIKNETATASGTLKHRFVWALMLWAFTENKINAKSTLYDSTSGNTGSAEAYMARLIGVPFVAVVSKDIEEEKIQQIKQFDGQIYKVESSERNAWAEKIARNNIGFFINRFGNADKAEEYLERRLFLYLQANRRNVESYFLSEQRSIPSLQH